MEETSGGRCGEIASDLSIIIVTAVQLIFFTRFHRYIAWPVTSPDGGVTRLSLLTDDYFTWLPFPTVASILVIVATVIMIFHSGFWFRQISWIGFCLVGIVVVLSLLLVFPFDFSAIPDTATANAAPRVLVVILILMIVFYGIAALVQAVKLISHSSRREVG